MASRITPQEFVQKWSNTELKESAVTQQHFIRRDPLLESSTSPSFRNNSNIATTTIDATEPKRAIKSDTRLPGSS